MQSSPHPASARRRLSFGSLVGVPGRLRLWLLATLFCAVAPQQTPAATRNTPDAPPEVAQTPTETIEVGTLNGTSYRIDIPNNWNHALVVFFHGYFEGVPVYHTTAAINDKLQPILERGYAVIQSAYSTSGWAMAEAYPETEQLRQYFLKRYGQPAAGKAGARNMETIVAGASMGGALVVAALELNPKPYAGGLDLCGSVGPTDLAFQRRFAWRAAFDFYFPGVLPPLVLVPSNFEESRALRKRVEDALRTNPAGAAAMRSLTGLHTDFEVADDMVYFTYVIGDMQHRAGGNPFDNRNFLYSGSSPTSSGPDNALNDGVRRYAADPHAREYLLHHYTPTGRLTRPMLALHTTYDPRIPAGTLSFYAEQVAEAGLSDNLVQQFVKRDGHCTFSEEEIGRAFDELIQWVRFGHRPTPGALLLQPRAAVTASR